MFVLSITMKMKKNKIQRVLMTELVKDPTLTSIGEKFTLNGITSIRDTDTQICTYPITNRDMVIASHLKIRMKKHNFEVSICQSVYEGVWNREN